MSEFKNIVDNHFQTFYNYNTNIKTRHVKRYALLLILSILVALLFPFFSNDFLNSVVGVFSIMIGFTLNVLFLLIAKPLVESGEAPSSRELVLKAKKIKKLQDEIISNVLYFNVVALTIVALAVLFLITSRLPLGELNVFGYSIFNINGKVDYRYFKIAFCVIQIIVVSLYYLMVFEAIYNLYRLVTRVSFLFRRKLQIENGN